METIRKATQSHSTLKLLKRMKEPYKVGLCLAGAATGGAYSAGVMDFFLEAMESWQREKDAGNENVPGWSVELTEMVGTSAGGITATLAASSLNKNHKPLPRSYKLGDEDPKNNALFSTWVKEMNCDRLLSNDDILSMPENERIVQSVLNANFMEEVSTEVLQRGEISEKAPIWAKNIHLSLTATNLRGIPYSINGFHSVQDESSFFMRRYKDYSEFIISDDPDSIRPIETRDATIIDMRKQRNSKDWKRAIDSSRATAAFPVGFPTVSIETPKDHYDYRLDIPPSWDGSETVESSASGAETSSLYRYSAVDGGALDNEPFELLEKHMQRRNGKILRRSGEQSWGSIILIDPFPDKYEDSEIKRGSLPIQEMVPALLNAVMGQAKFKEDELRSAFSPNNMEKFIIKPERVNKKKNQEYTLATGNLQSFGGIIDEKIRLHDFLLGRKNCKYFLENVFVLRREEAIQNPLFKDHSTHLNSDKIPIIPVVGSAAESIEEPKWPFYSAQESEEVVDKLMDHLDERVPLIIDTAMKNLGLIKPVSIFQNPFQWPKNSMMEIFRDILSKRACEKLKGEIEIAMKVYS